MYLLFCMEEYLCHYVPFSETHLCNYRFGSAESDKCTLKNYKQDLW